MKDPFDEGTLDMFTDTHLFPDEREVHFSPCRTWRYSLKITWEPGRLILPVIMLNPSTADEVKNDPTIERVQRRALKLRYGGVEVFNLFAYRATDPKDMKKAHKAGVDIVGPDNNAVLKRMFDAQAVYTRQFGRAPILVGWGNHGSFNARDADIAEMAQDAGVSLVCLAINEKTGQPKHPLYCAYDRVFQGWPAG